eukprot:Pgem_evm1s17596
MYASISGEKANSKDDDTKEMDIFVPNGLKTFRKIKIKCLLNGTVLQLIGHSLWKYTSL